MKKIKILTLFGALSFPSLVLAAPQPGNFKDLVDIFLGLITQIIPVLMALTVLVFIWGLFDYMRSEGSERVEGRKFIVWGIIALFVMASLWGLVGILSGTVFGGGGGEGDTYDLDYGGTTN